jgi:hypothetical protein
LYWAEVMTVTRWIGRAVMAIGVLHTVVGLSLFHSTLSDLFADGLVDTVHGPVRGYAFWFVFFGLLCGLLGALVDWCEQSPRPLPVFLGLGLLSLTIVCLTLMPASGGWLLLVPAVGAVLRSRAATSAARA